MQGKPPKSVNLYWRRFAMSSIPLDDPQSFDRWMRQRWIEKDDLLESFMQHGHFPTAPTLSSSQVDGQGDEGVTHPADYIETEVRQKHWWEIGQLLFGLLAAVILVRLLSGIWTLLTAGGWPGIT